jgi:hypothetical protein
LPCLGYLCLHHTAHIAPTERGVWVCHFFPTFSLFGTMFA